MTKMVSTPYFCPICGGRITASLVEGERKMIYSIQCEDEERGHAEEHSEVYSGVLDGIEWQLGSSWAEEAWDSIPSTEAESV